MHPVEVAGIGQIRQVAPDGLQGHVKALRQVLDGDPALVARNLQDLGLPETQRHGDLP
jgi:hypothetical protein